MIITAYNEVIPNVVVEGQRKVLEKFGEKRLFKLNLKYGAVMHIQ